MIWLSQKLGEQWWGFLFALTATGAGLDQGKDKGGDGGVGGADFYDDAGDGDDDDGDKVDGVVVGGDGDGDNGDGETASAVPFGFSHFPAVSFVASLSRLSVRLFYTLCTAVFNTHFDCGIVPLLDIFALISRVSLIHCVRKTLSSW